MLKKITPNLVVKDVNETVKFYQDKLGMFELTGTEPQKGKYDWAVMRCEDTEIMFQSAESLSDKIPSFINMKTGGTIILYIEVDAIEQLYDLVKDKVCIIKELTSTPYGIKEFLIKDCNGFILSFAEPDQL